jgi:hypothetical protein
MEVAWGTARAGTATATEALMTGGPSVAAKAMGSCSRQLVV